MSVKVKSTNGWVPSKETPRIFSLSIFGSPLWLHIQPQHVRNYTMECLIITLTKLMMSGLMSSCPGGKSSSLKKKKKTQQKLVGFLHHYSSTHGNNLLQLHPSVSKSICKLKKKSWVILIAGETRGPNPCSSFYSASHPEWIWKEAVLFMPLTRRTSKEKERKRWMEMQQKGSWVVTRGCKPICNSQLVLAKPCAGSMWLVDKIILPEFPAVMRGQMFLVNLARHKTLTWTFRKYDQKKYRLDQFILSPDFSNHSLKEYVFPVCQSSEPYVVGSDNVCRMCISC